MTTKAITPLRQRMTRRQPPNQGVKKSPDIPVGVG
jgi:hypothetical protein